MKDIRDQAKQYQKDVEMRAVAHEASSEWHRRRGVCLGGVATVLSAVVGTSIFATLTTQLKEGKFDLSGFGDWSWAIFAVFGFALVLSPVLTGMQAYLKHPEQAATHKASYVVPPPATHRTFFSFGIRMMILQTPTECGLWNSLMRSLETSKK